MAEYVQRTKQNWAYLTVGATMCVEEAPPGYDSQMPFPTAGMNADARNAPMFRGVGRDHLIHLAECGC